MTNLQQLQAHGIDAKKNYMEGAIWMGNKIVKEIASLQQSLDFFIEEYKSRIGPRDDQQIRQTELWLIDSINRSQQALVEKANEMIDSTNVLKN